ARILGGGTLYLDGTASAYGSLYVAGSVVNASALTLQGNTDLQLGAAQTFTNTSAGTVQLASGQLGFDASWSFVNQGAVPAVPYAGAGDLVSAAFVTQTSGTVHAESGVPYLSFWGGGTASGQAGVTTFRGDPGTALVLAGLTFDGSTSIAADAAYLYSS